MLLLIEFQNEKPFLKIMNENCIFFYSNPPKYETETYENYFTGYIVL